MQAHNLYTALTAVSAAQVKTAEDDANAFPRLTSYNDGAVYVGRFAGQSPWECHPTSDELLHILEGEVEITLLTDPKATTITVGAGNIVVVPKGVWHRQLANPSVALLAVTPDHSLVSFDDDPRISSTRKGILTGG